jgi:hypothetical protein
MNPLLRKTLYGVLLLLVVYLVFTWIWGSRNWKVTVTGTVTFNGKPVEEGIITFLLAEDVKGGTSAAGGIKDGKFTVPDVSPGKNTVLVQASEKGSGAPATYQQAKGGGQKMAPGGGMAAAMKGFAGKGAPGKEGRRALRDMAKAMDTMLRARIGLGPKLIPEDAIGNCQVIPIKHGMQPLDLQLQSPPEDK